MPELIERGYIYIAQPPLYRVKRGKQVQYVKDDKALNEYLVQIALEDAQLFINPAAPPITGLIFEKMVKQYSAVMDIISRLSRRYPSSVLEALIDMPKVTATELQDLAFMENWGKSLTTILESHAQQGLHFNLSFTEDRERKAHLPNIVMKTHGVEHTYQFNYEFFISHDYAAIAALAAELKGLLEAGAYIQRGDKKYGISSFKEAVAWLMEEAKKGQQISRYKGLGEMNPDQLRETTMDPMVRRMLKVRIEDAVAADQIFTTLMGDNVESRREFIEINALLAGNLDI